jgi:hypothetical protein
MGSLSAELLKKADTIDKYQSACQRDALNARARIGCDYVPWHDQSQGYKAQKIVGSGYHIVIMNPSADAGLPHTRATNLICIPAFFPQERLQETLQHEMIHVNQRENEERWKEQLIQQGWSPVSEWEAIASIPQEHLRRCRLNPDTISCRFQAWGNRYVPLPLFIRDDKPSLKETVVKWYDLEDERLRSDPPISYTKRYGKVGMSSQEHPFELWAYSNESK